MHSSRGCVVLRVMQENKVGIPGRCSLKFLFLCESLFLCTKQCSQLRLLRYELIHFDSTVLLLLFRCLLLHRLFSTSEVRLFSFSSIAVLHSICEISRCSC